MSTLNLISFAVHVIIFILLKKKENTWNEISMNKLKLNMRKLQFRNSNSITRGTFVHFLLLQQALEIVLVKKTKEVEKHHMFKVLIRLFNLFVILHKQWQ